MTDDSRAQQEDRVDPDVGLMLRVRDDDAVAFEMLIDRHQGKIIRFMQGWVSNVQQAEDLAQEVFLRVFKARKSYVPTAKFTTWMYRIAHNIASNYLRDSSHRKEYQLSKGENSSSGDMLLENVAVAPSGFHPARPLDTAERSSIVLQSLQALGERQRTAIMLSKFEGMSVQAVKSLLSRARGNLKNLLEPYIDLGLTPKASVVADDSSPASQGEDE